MNNQKAMFVIIAIVAALSVATIVPAMIRTSLLLPGAGDGNPHKDHKTGNPHFCPDSQCD